MIKFRYSLALLFLCLLCVSCELSAVKTDNLETLHQTPQAALIELLQKARRIPNSSEWFEIIELPNNVYAFWEPGHQEKVNAFLILGSEKDVLYDTGMGIASISKAISELRKNEKLPEKTLMVINSHNHLDHNGGNSDFDVTWIYKNDWGFEKLTQGIPGGASGGFVEYWDQLTEHHGVHAPSNFDPLTQSIPPFPRENIRFLTDGDVVDLGDRKFQVMHMTSHSPDGLALYDKRNEILFGGDTFYGPDYLVIQLSLLADDLEKTRNLKVKWHYASHGPQLIETMQHGIHLSIVRRMLDGERAENTTNFAGFELPIYSLDGVSVTVAGQLLTY